jgi:hypothetical protein
MHSLGHAPPANTIPPFEHLGRDRVLACMCVQHGHFLAGPCSERGVSRPGAIAVGAAALPIYTRKEIVARHRCCRHPPRYPTYSLRSVRSRFCETPFFSHAFSSLFEGTIAVLRDSLTDCALVPFFIFSPPSCALLSSHTNPLHPAPHLACHCPPNASLLLSHLCACVSDHIHHFFVASTACPNGMLLAVIVPALLFPLDPSPFSFLLFSS